MNIFPFFSFPITKEELKLLRDNLNSLDLDSEASPDSHLKKPVCIGRTEHVSIDVADMGNDFFTIGILHTSSTPVLPKEVVDNILDKHPEFKEGFEANKGNSQ